MDGISDASIASLVTTAMHSEFSFLRGEAALPPPFLGLKDDPRIAELVRKRAGTSSFYSLLRWLWYRELPLDDFERHGLAIFLNNPWMPSAGAGARSIFELLHESFAGPSVPRKREARGALRVIAKGYAASPKRVMLVSRQHPRTSSPDTLGDWWLVRSNDIWKFFLEASSRERDLFVATLGLFTIAGSAFEFIHKKIEAEELGIVPTLKKTDEVAIEQGIKLNRCEDDPLVKAYKHWRAGEEFVEFVEAG